MSLEMLTVLWIAAVGSSLLFIALSGLIGLMYLLTAPWPFRRKGRPRAANGFGEPRRSSNERSGAAPTPVVGAAGTEASDPDRARRRRAAAIAVALACAERDGATLAATDAPSNWRLMHRARQLAPSSVRQRVRS
jgi:hypothetical protein